MKFLCYRYQLPNDPNCIQSEEFSSEHLTPAQAKERKNEFFIKYLIEESQILQQEKNNKKYSFKYFSLGKELYIFQIGKKGTTNLTDDSLENKHKEVHYNKQIFIIIDNNPDVQVIAIESSSRITFDEINKNLFSMVKKRLNTVLLDLIIQPISNDNKFWETVNKYNGRITDLNYTVFAPNMSSLTKDAAEFTKTLRSNLQADSTELHATSMNKLNISNKDNNVNSMVESATAGLAKLTLSARLSENSNEKGVVYDSEEGKQIYFFALTHDKLAAITENKTDKHIDELNKLEQTLKRFKTRS